MADLKQMLQNLQGGPLPRRTPMEQSRKAQQALKNLRGLVRRQQNLLDETYGRAQRERDQRNQERIERSTEGQTEQDSIRKQLGHMMRKFGDRWAEIPKRSRGSRASHEGVRTSLGAGAPG